VEGGEGAPNLLRTPWMFIVMELGNSWTASESLMTRWQ
jgi:hypothetical protein